MRVIVCDGDWYFCKQIAKYIRQFEKETQTGITLYLFESETKMCDFLLKTPGIDIIFLDIVFQEEKGIQIAKEIRKRNQKVCIVFVSSLDKFAVQGYDVQAQGYLLKPLDYHKFKDKMNMLIRKLNKERERFYCDITKEGRLVLPFDEIMYIETKGRNTAIHTPTESFNSYRKMKEHQILLEPEGFCRCHAAYIVNLQYVKRVDGQEIYLKNHEMLHISKTKKKEFYDMFVDYIERYYSK